MAAGLTTIAYYTRQGIKWGTVGVILYIILRIVATYTYNAYLESRPEPEPPAPVPLFGKMPPLTFPDTGQNISFTYQLETISGDLPGNLPDRAKVFIHAVRSPDLNTVKNTITFAKSFGFTGNYISLNNEGTHLRWVNPSGISSVFEYHVFTRHFDLVRDWPNQQAFYARRRRVSSAQLKSRVADNLRKGKVWGGESWDNGARIFYTFFRHNNGQLIQVGTLGEADFIQANVDPPRIDNLPYVYADARRPAIWLLMSTGHVVEIHAHYNTRTNNVSEYPLEPIGPIWQKVKDNQGHVARLGENIPGQTIKIRNVYLAYYLPNDWELFLQPVYVFEGDNDFQVIHHAIDQRVINQTN